MATRRVAIIVVRGFSIETHAVEHGFESHSLEIAVIIHLVVVVHMPELLRHLI
jgi:hypothetical protein